MGITIESRFINIKKCEEFLEDIILKNFYYYSLVNYDANEMIIIKERCKNLLLEKLFINDDFFDFIWRKIYIRMTCIEEQFLYL